MVQFYTTEGSVRGCCGHKHRSIATAKRCIDKDQAGCATQGGYSDRDVIRYDGSELSENEKTEISILLNFNLFYQYP